MQKAKTPALRLLLACARAHPAAGDEKNLRQLLAGGIDWTPFAQKTIDHGLAGLAGHTLQRLVPDLVPDDILQAFQAFITQTRASNQRLLEELARLVDALAAAGVKAIPFKGPVLAQQAFGDLGLRGFRDLDFLIQDPDLPQTIAILDSCGYARGDKLTVQQFSVIHRLQGQEVLFNPDKGVVEPHTRLTFLKMALDIDYQGLWRRARPENIFGRTMLTLAPEDTMIVLALHGGKELWWDIKWACDVADFIASHPALDWAEVAARARAQGCYRMLLVATALARGSLGAGIPDSLIAAEVRDRAVGQIVGRILARWEAEDPGGPPSNKTLSMDRLRLHDGFVRQTSYVLRTLFLPGPQHITLVALRRILEFAYIPIGLAHDLIALPLYRLWQASKSWAAQARTALALSPLPLVLASPPNRERLKYFQQTYRDAEKALAADARDYQAWGRMAEALAALNRPAEAVVCFDKALTIFPDHDANWRMRGEVLAANNRVQADATPKADSRSAGGWAIVAGYFLSQRRYQDASKASQSSLRLEPNHKAATAIGIKARLYACDWRQREQDKTAAAAGAKTGALIIRPISLKQIIDSEPLSLSLARLLAAKENPSAKPLWRGEKYRHDKIRVAYLSTDMRSHPVGWTIVAPLEHHDKSRFEITAISTGPDDGSQVRKRIQAAADRFLDVRTMAGPGAIAKVLRELEIDIAIDLNGLTGDNRGKGVLAHRPAPLQVNYLGYPGTTALAFMDYIIADPILIPDQNRAFYSEKIAYLPNSYMACDGARAISSKVFSRAEQGLPDDGFVFTCFNNLHKLGPEIFSVWMRLMQAVEGSVLWISNALPAVTANLRREAQMHGIAPERLVFARFEEKAEDHLARQCLGDLFLDTLPYNAHSTAGEALWAGLPLLTCQGQSFQARVASSLLRAAGLPELVTTSLADYEKRALELAQDPGQLAAIRQKLAENRATAPLFDTARFTRDLERVYTAMWQRQQAGEPPADISVRE